MKLLAAAGLARVQSLRALRLQARSRVQLFGARFIAFLLLFVASQTGAQVMMGSISMWNTNNMLNRQVMQIVNKPIFEKAEFDAGRRVSASRLAARSDLAATTTAFREQGETAAEPPTRKLAQIYPEAKRAEAERVFVEMLRGYRKIEQQFGIQRNDVAGAVAAFLVGSYMAYQNTAFPDAHVKPLVDQLGPIIARSPEFTKATNAERKDLYENMAILGMFMATTQMALQQKPNAETSANMRTAAKAYLEQFLKTDADRVQITAQGLVLR